MVVMNKPISFFLTLLLLLALLVLLLKTTTRSVCEAAWSSSSSSSRARRRRTQTASASKTTTTSSSSSNTQQISRRDWFQKTTAALVVGAAATSATTSALPSPAYAATATSTKLPVEASDLVRPQSLVDKTVVITGASSGLGLESAKVLAAKGGATLILTTRSESKGKQTVRAVRDYCTQNGASNNNNIHYVSLDLDDLNSVKSFTSRLDEVLPKDKSIDVLLNNAGVMAIPNRQLTKDNFERTFQSNHLGHFVLTQQLLPRLLKSKDARVINVSSLAYNIAGGNLDFDNLNSDKSYGAWKSYGYSKLENILFTEELQRRADDAGLSQLTAYSLHPGAVNTDLARYFVGEDKWTQKKISGPTTLLEKFVDRAVQGALLTPQQGAATQVYLATSPLNKLQPSAFYSDLQSQKLPKYALDEQQAQQLWKASEELSGIQFKL